MLARTKLGTRLGRRLVEAEGLPPSSARERCLGMVCIGRESQLCSSCLEHPADSSNGTHSRANTPAGQLHYTNSNVTQTNGA